MKNTFYRKSVYGRERIYLVDTAMERVHSILSGRKTLERSDIEAYKALGVELMEVIAPSFILLGMLTF